MNLFCDFCLQKGLDGNNSVLHPLMKCLLDKVTEVEHRDLVVEFFVGASERFCQADSNTPVKALCFVSFFHLVTLLSGLSDVNLSNVMDRLINTSFCGQLHFHLSRRGLPAAQFGDHSFWCPS